MHPIRLNLAKVVAYSRHNCEILCANDEHKKPDTQRHTDLEPCNDLYGDQRADCPGKHSGRNRLCKSCSDLHNQPHRLTQANLPYWFARSASIWRHFATFRLCSASVSANA